MSLSVCVCVYADMYVYIYIYIEDGSYLEGRLTLVKALCKPPSARSVSIGLLGLFGLLCRHYHHVLVIISITPPVQGAVHEFCLNIIVIYMYIYIIKYGDMTVCVCVYIFMLAGQVREEAAVELIGLSLVPLGQYTITDTSSPDNPNKPDNPNNSSSGVESLVDRKSVPPSPPSLPEHVKNVYLALLEHKHVLPESELTHETNSRVFWPLSRDLRHLAYNSNNPNNANNPDRDPERKEVKLSPLLCDNVMTLCLQLTEAWIQTYRRTVNTESHAHSRSRNGLRLNNQTVNSSRNSRNIVENSDPNGRVTVWDS